MSSSLEAQPQHLVKVEDLLLMVDKIQKENWNPRIEEMINKIKELQQAHEIAAEEIRESHAVKEALKKELNELSMEKTLLEEILSKKQETLHILEWHYKEKEKKILRQQEMSQNCIQRITELKLKIQEEKLKRKNQRMEFQQQLEELMEKHKALCEFHTPQRLAQEISTMASEKEQLLKDESLLQEKLDAIQKQLADLPQPEAKAEILAENSESAFLRSEEAATALHLFEEENMKAMQFLEAASKLYSQHYDRYHRLKKDLEAIGQGDIRGPKENSIEAAAEVALGEPVMEFPGTQEKEQNIDPNQGNYPTGQASLLF